SGNRRSSHRKIARHRKPDRQNGAVLKPNPCPTNVNATSARVASAEDGAVTEISSSIANDTGVPPVLENVNTPPVEIEMVPTEEPFCFTVNVAVAVGLVPQFP